MLRFVDGISLLTPVHPNENKVLLIRPDNIGDFVVWLDAAMAITEFYRVQGKQVVLLGNASWAGWAEELGVFDSVLPLHTERYKRDFRYRIGMARQLRTLGFEISVHAPMTRVEELGDSLVRVSGAPKRIGARSEARPGTADRWYTRLLPRNTSELGELRRNASFVRELTSARYQPRVADLRARVLAPRQADSVSTPDRPYFVLFPGASDAGRKWPAERFIRLARQIHSRTGWRGIVCGGPGDVKDADAIVSAAATFMTSLAGTTTLGELARVLATAEVLISNETSAVHMAAALRVPSVCITGGGHFGRFVPYGLEDTELAALPRIAAQWMACFGCNWMCKYHPPKGSPMPCVEEVSVAAVWEQVGACLGMPLDLEASGLVQLTYPTKEEFADALVGI